ncbi:MAG: thiamine-phosphate kinase [Syntrophomonadaceae bacterium]|nr:thiamine-phosphate kinase [Syntrophomonadaceae bacterium]
MLIREIGEFGLIGRLMGGRSLPPGVIRGAGDDAAVLQISRDSRLLVTGDMLVEGTHFLRDQASFFDLGYKLLAVNLSDIAAMAGIPRFAVVFLGLPADLTVEAVEELYRGLQYLADRHRVAIVGGDTVRCQLLTLGLTLLGEGKPSQVLLRSGARAGDLLAVTGTLGGSAAGLAVVLGQVAVEEESAREALAAHYRPQPRVEEGLRLGLLKSVGAMIDISDSLASEVAHLCRESGVGAELWGEAVPIAPEVPRIAQELGQSPLHLALYGGEDYELLFAVNPAGWERVKAEMAELGTPVTAIGKFTASPGKIELVVSGQRQPLAGNGYDHFKKTSRRVSSCDRRRSP